MKTQHSFNVGYYLKQPEFRPVFYLVPLLVVVFGIIIAYTPLVWGWISAGVFVLFVVILSTMSWRLSVVNAEEKTKASQMESIVSHLSVGVIAYDTNFKVVAFNSAAEEIFGIKSNTIIGKQLSAQMGKDSSYRLLAQTVFSSLAPRVVTLSEGDSYPQVVDISFQQPVMELRVITDRIFDEKGEVAGFVKLVTDKTRETELLNSKTEFIGVAAHQLRTPLTAIEWSLETLSSSKNLKGQEKEMAVTGLEASKKMIKTVNDLLDISKIEEGKFGYDFESVDLTEFLSTLLEQQNIVAKQYGITLYFQRPKQPVKVIIDEQKVSMVVSNLLDNAIKYNVKNGSVTVSAALSNDPSFALVSVADTGVGIPKDAYTKLFSKFYRGENVIQKITDGTGLGLYISRNIITRHGGKIWFESELNRGTIFYFTLPTRQDVIPKKKLTDW